MCTSFIYLQGWWLNHFPGQPVPMIHNPGSEGIFPDTQSKPVLVQLEAVCPCLIACYLGEETNTRLTTTSFQVVVESNEASPQSTFLQTEQPQFPQLLLTGHRTCSPDPWSASLPSSGHAPAPKHPSCSDGPKTAHSTRGAASPVPSTGARSPARSCWPHHSWYNSYTSEDYCALFSCSQGMFARKMMTFVRHIYFG